MYHPLFSLQWSAPMATNWLSLALFLSVPFINLGTFISSAAPRPLAANYALALSIDIDLQSLIHSVTAGFVFLNGGKCHAQNATQQMFIRHGPFALLCIHHWHAVSKHITADEFIIGSMFACLSTRPFVWSIYGTPVFSLPLALSFTPSYTRSAC